MSTQRHRALLLTVLILTACMPPNDAQTNNGAGMPAEPPALRGEAQMLRDILARRRSVRTFTKQDLSNEELLQLAWAGQGRTHPAGLRTAPSAGALYPLELYVATAAACLRYDPAQDAFVEHLPGDLRPELFREALQQASVRDAPAVFIITAVFGRMRERYGDRTERYTHLEAGHAAQNLLLMATALTLGGVPIGAFSDSGISTALSLPEDEIPLYLIPVGRPTGAAS